MTNKHWRIIRSITAVGTAVVTLHGVSSKRWKTGHSVILIVGVIASIGAALTKPKAGPEEPVLQINL